jgi:hypothetical protein
MEFIFDQGTHFVNKTIVILTTKFMVNHKKSPPTTQGISMVESTNKTLENILRKIINANCTDWDENIMGLQKFL